MAKQTFTRDQAEALSLKALVFLASDEARLTRFLQLTGLAPETLRAQADTPEILAAVLDHILADQTLLLVFAAGEAIEPDQIERARVLISGVDNPGVWL